MINKADYDMTDPADRDQYHHDVQMEKLAKARKPTANPVPIIHPKDRDPDEALLGE